MSFLGMGTFEILIILLVAFIFLGPERMIDAARILGKWTGELRRMGSTVQAEMDDLTNVGAPLSSRYEQTRSERSPEGVAQSLDQDHPPERSNPATAANPNSAASAPVTGSSEGAVSPNGKDEPSARKEETV